MSQPDEPAQFRDELRTQTRLLNELREMQVEQGQKLAKLESGVAGLELKVTRLNVEVTAGLAQIVSMLNGLSRS